MQCNYVREMILTDYTDNELSAAQSKTISEHIASCEDCFNFHKQVQQITVAPIRFSETKPMPSHLWEKVSEKIKNNSIEKEQKKIIYAKIFLECACAAALIVCMFSFFSLIQKPLYTNQTDINSTSYLSTNTSKTTLPELFYL